MPYGPVTLHTGGAGKSAPGYATTLRWSPFALPKGLTLSSAGVLAGTLSSNLLPGTTAVTVQVTETVTTLSGTRKVETKTTVQATTRLTIA